mmetsp:Transcript_24333/g.61812  ORF Transcript_24333/g.61812 Transcript_24333/m.61812 type:complete len:332 (+) Transcript_24333:57-1052(+)
MLIEPLLRDESPQAARSGARWKCLLLAILLGTCSISIIVSLPSRAAARGKASLLASTAADVEPEASLSHVAPASSADVDGFVIPPPCLSVMAVTALSGTALLVSLTAAVPAMGFLEDGVAAESIAATWQATIGNVEKESLFASLQSLAARRKLLTILAIGLPVTGNLAVASAAFCSKLDAQVDAIEDATVAAAHTVANTSAAALTQVQRAAQAALTQIQQAAQDSGAVDSLQAAAVSLEGAAKGVESAAVSAAGASTAAAGAAAGTAKEAADKIVAQAEAWAEEASKQADGMAREAGDVAREAADKVAEAVSPATDAVKSVWEEVTGWLKG